MRLLDISIQTTPQTVRLVGTLQTAQGRSEVYFAFPARYREFLALSADPFVAAMLVPSMAAHEPLEIAPPVSDLLLFNLPRIRDIFHSWFPQFARIEIRASSRGHDPGPPAHRSASFFSGGVDSFYTLLKRLRSEPLPAPLTHMIFMRGIEQKLEKSKGVDASQALAEEIAARTGVECIVGETNIRTKLPLHWENYYFGSGLAGTALALSGGLGYVCIGSGFSYSHQVPHGSTPLVDERYSTERLRIVHDGAEVTRAQKVACILGWDRELVLEYLRVCIENAGGAYNCGRCYKCVRTAVALRCMGAWQDAACFADKSTGHWERVAFNDHLALTQENLALARERGGDRELTELLERVVRRKLRRENLSALVHGSPLEHLLPLVRYARRLAR